MQGYADFGMPPHFLHSCFALDVSANWPYHIQFSLRSLVHPLCIPYPPVHPCANPHVLTISPLHTPVDPPADARPPEHPAYSPVDANWGTPGEVQEPAELAFQ